MSDVRRIEPHPDGRSVSPDLGDAMERCSAAIIKAVRQVERRNGDFEGASADELREHVRRFVWLLREAGLARGDAVGLVRRLARGIGPDPSDAARVTNLVIQYANDAYLS